MVEQRIKTWIKSLSRRSRGNSTFGSCLSSERFLVAFINGYHASHSRGGGVLPYMGYIGMCGPKGYGSSGVLVINRVSILAILVLSRVWF